LIEFFWDCVQLHSKEIKTLLEFQYKREKSNILISLKTDSTQFGTFHRIATIIYALKLDILSGELGTVIENGNSFTVDSFILQADESTVTQAAFQLGVMMDSLFSKNEKFEEILSNLQIQEPAIGTFFKENPEFIFTDLLEKGETCLYLESSAGRGLLYYVSRILMDNSINIISATIETDPKTGRAKDSFYLTNSEGAMFGSSPLAEKIRDQILAPIHTV
jgi:UTP:GlnB (protein PII) uridylyltransferase